MSAQFRRIKETVLGAEYELSVAFLSAEEMRAVTKRTKGVDKVSNVLAFSLSDTSGEILLCKSAAKPYSVEYLFIHGLLHLKGLKHSARMDATEEKLLREFKLCKKSSQE